MLVEDPERAVAAGPFALELGRVLVDPAEDLDPEPRDRQIRLDLVLLEEHPLQDARPLERIVRHPLRPVAEIPQDRVRLAEMLPVVELERRHAQRGILSAQYLAPVRPVDDVELDALVLDPAQRKDLPHLPAVP